MTVKWDLDAEKDRKILKRKREKPSRYGRVLFWSLPLMALLGVALVLDLRR